MLCEHRTRDSKLTMLLRESLGNINCRTTMIAHISDSPANYADSLNTIQLASRIHRMRKKKTKVCRHKTNKPGANVLLPIAVVCCSVVCSFSFDGNVTQ